MPAKLLDGSAVAAEIRAEIKDKIAARLVGQKGKYGTSGQYPPPVLAVVLASDDPASEVYVKRKREACDEVGITSFLIRPFEGGIEKWSKRRDHLLKTIDYLNEDSSVHGILVQLPLPKELDESGFPGVKLPPFQYEVFDRIDPLKDVDVFSPVNVGLLLQGRPRYVPCTPAGIQELLTRSGIEIKGKKVCIINRSDVVGKPLHALLIQNNEEANATVCVCHDHTPPQRLKEVCLRSDIIVVAVGIPGFLTADMVREGAVVVDVGINRLPDSKKIVGDVDFGPVSQKATAISPVPGGVGPMTVTMLLRNTLMAQNFLLSR